MSQKKHIDRLFQEKFKEFEASPDPKLWNNLEKELTDNPIKATSLPLWYKVAGIAGLLIITLFIGKLISKSYDNTLDSFEEITTTNRDNLIHSKSSNHQNTSKAEKQSINFSDETTIGTNTSTNKSSIYNTANNKSSSEIENSSKTSILNSQYNAATENKTVLQKSSSIIKSANSNHNNSVEKVSMLEKNTTTSSQSFASQNKPNKTGVSSTKTNLKNSNRLVKIEKPNPSIHSNQSINTSQNNRSQIAKNTRNKIIISTPIHPNSNSVNSSKSTEGFHLYIEPQPLVVLKDSLASSPIVIRNGLTIEKAIKEYEKRIKKETVGKRWTIAPNIAPVYYNSFGEGSQFGSQFKNNSKTGETNTSYGLKVGFTLNENFIIRTGLSRLNLSYDTDDVIVFESISNQQPQKPMENIDFSTFPNNQNLNVMSSNNLFVLQINSNSSFDAALSQRINYLEIPIELEYKLNKNRFGVNIIGGFSTFILQNNQVVSEFDGYSTTIGEANNINNVSFSTNIGLGLNYKFSPVFICNFEPTFKYQINGFTNTSGSFNPYIIGIYTGFSYKF